MKGIALAGAVVIGLFAPAFAQADVESLTVDTTSDSGALTACTAAAADCSLRGAASVANDADPGTDVDTIDFDTTIFDGSEAVPGEATIVLADAVGFTDSVVVQANCAGQAAQPCVGIDGPDDDNALAVTEGSFTMRRVAIFGTLFQGIFYAGFADGLTLSANWFGLRLNGNPSGNGVGVNVTAGNADIGSASASPNVFGANGIGLFIFTASDVVVANNRFGQTPGGTLAANTDADIMITGNGGGDDPTDITIGGEPNATAACDGSCNVLAAAGGAGSGGVNLFGDGSAGLSSTASDVQITGNHIGLDTDGTSATGTGTLVPVGAADQVTVSDNHLAGGLFGITAGSTAEDLVVEGNSLGTDSAQTTVLDGASVASIFVNSNLVTPTAVRDNLVTQDSAVQALVVGNTAATVDGNQVGLPGDPGSGGQTGISAQGVGHTITGNSVSETTDDAIDLTDASTTEVSGNSIGEGGPIGGDAISIGAASGNSSGNTIGSDKKSGANVIADTAGSAIKIAGDGQDLNAILMNLGASDDFFVDLEGSDGPGNGATGPNAGIESPKVKKVKKDEVSGTGVPGAEVWVYRTKSGSGDFPESLKKLIGTKNVKNDGSWKLKPDSKIKGKHVITALQVDQNDNSSELAKGKKIKK